MQVADKPAIIVGKRGILRLLNRFSIKIDIVFKSRTII